MARFCKMTELAEAMFTGIKQEGYPHFQEEPKPNSTCRKLEPVQQDDSSSCSCPSRSQVIGDPGHLEDNMNNSEMNFTKEAQEDAANEQQIGLELTCNTQQPSNNFANNYPSPDETTRMVQYSSASLQPRTNNKAYFICLICGFKLSSVGRLQQHERGHEKRNRDSQDMFECPLEKCQAVFECESDLYQHCEEHLLRSPKVCNMCGGAFLVEAQLKQHMARHSEVHQCTYRGCGKWFLYGRELQGHMKSHESEKYLQCSLCGTYSQSKQQYTEHMMSTHAEENLFVCDMPGCDKFFRKIHGLKQHKLTHCDERLHRCPGCNVNYKYAHSLQKHVRKESEQAPYVCQQNGCGQTFSMACVLSQHMATSHSIGSKCHYCGRVYNTPGYFEKHLATHMGQDASIPQDHVATPSQVHPVGLGYLGHIGPAPVPPMQNIGGFLTSQGLHNAPNNGQIYRHSQSVDDRLLAVRDYQKQRMAFSEDQAKIAFQRRWSADAQSLFKTEVPTPTAKSPRSVGSMSPKDSSGSGKTLSIEQCKNMMFNNLSKRHRSLILNTNVVSEKSVCGLCNAVFTSHDEFEVHMKFHMDHDGQNIDCPGIQDKANTDLPKPTVVLPTPQIQGNTMHNQSTQLGTNQYKCTLPGCSKVCRTASNLKQHMEGVHPFDEIRVRCPCCYMVYKNRKYLKGHMKREKEHPQYYCEEDGCSEVFSMGCILIQHRAFVHNVGSLCMKCGIVYTTDISMKKHMKMHELPEGNPMPFGDDTVYEFDGVNWISTKPRNDQSTAMQPNNGTQFQIVRNNENAQSSENRDLSGTFEFEGTSYHVELQSDTSSDPYLNVDNMDTSCPLIMNVSNEEFSDKAEDETNDDAPNVDTKPTVSDHVSDDRTPNKNSLIARIKLSADQRFHAYNAHHKCNNCDHSFPSFEKLRQHNSLCQSWKCSVCLLVFSSREELQSHTEKSHRRELGIQRCPYPGCLAQFQFPGDLGKHILVDHIRKKHSPPAMCMGDFVEDKTAMDQYVNPQQNQEFISSAEMTPSLGVRSTGTFTPGPVTGIEQQTSDVPLMWHKPCTAPLQAIAGTTGATETSNNECFSPSVKSEQSQL